MSDASDLSSMSRSALQALAKKHNVKANMKSEEIIEQLQANAELNQASRSLARSASEALPKNIGSSNPLQNSRSATQPLLRNVRSRTASVALPEGRTSRRPKAPIAQIAHEGEDNVLDLVQEEPELQDSGSKPTTKDAVPAEGSSRPARLPRKARETQKRLGVGRPKLIGGTGARRSTAKPKFFTPTKGKTVEVVLPARKVTKVESQPPTTQTAVDIVTSSQTASSSRKQTALEATVTSLKTQLTETKETLALEREKVVDLQARVDDLAARLVALEQVAGKVAVLEAMLANFAGQSLEVSQAIPIGGDIVAGEGLAVAVQTEENVQSEPASRLAEDAVAIAMDVVSQSLSNHSPDSDQPVASTSFTNLPPPVIGKRLRRQSSNASLSSMGMDSSPKKRARLDSSLESLGIDQQDATEVGGPSLPVVIRRISSSRESASIPPISALAGSAIATNSQPIASSSSPYRSVVSSSSVRSKYVFRSTSHPAETPNPSLSHPITASANQTENQLRASSVGVQNGGSSRSSTRVSLRTLASHGNPIAGPSRNTGWRAKERTFEVGRYSAQGSNPSTVERGNELPPTSSPSRRNPRQSSSPSNPTASTTPAVVDGSTRPLHTTASPLPPESDISPDQENHYPDPVTHLEPLTLFDSGKDFMGTPKQKYHNDWHTGIVFDDVFDAETAEVVRRHAEVAADGGEYGGGPFGIGMEFDGQVVHPTIIEESDEELDGHGEHETRSPLEVSWEASLGIQTVRQDDMDTDGL